MSKINVLVTLLLLTALLACSDESGVEEVRPMASVIPIRLVEVDPLIQVKINSVPVDLQFDIGNTMRKVHIFVCAPIIGAISEGK